MPQRRQERTTLVCGGCDPYHSLAIPPHAKGCPLTKDFLPRQLKAYKRGWTSAPCLGASHLLVASEENLKKQWAETHPNENCDRIRSIEDLKRLQRKLTNQSTFSSKKPKPVRGKDLPHRIDPAVPERTRKWRREKSPPPVGLCGLCHTLTWEYHKNRPTRFHRECVREYQREHGAELAGPRNADGTFSALTSKPIKERPWRGPPVQPECLQKHFMWTIHHKLLGDSLGKIAKDDDEHPGRSTVVDGIEFIMGKVAKDGSVKKSVLPLPERVPLPARQRIIALRALADPRCLIQPLI
jgi:hypothetical protein